MIDQNVKKAMELINAQKEEIAKEKSNIVLAEGRREDNLENIKNLNQKIKDLGYDPEKIEDVLLEMEKVLNSKNQELLEIIEELETSNEL